uniref:Uncharacterized protein n=1 Tax=Panagrolaimus sp. JU765 TaxID=591449 RepID=A0AC34Q0Z6_9BILA
MAGLLKKYQHLIGHIQIAQVPNRNEPDSPGEINYEYVFDVLKETNNDWIIGCEYFNKNPNTTNWVENNYLILLFFVCFGHVKSDEIVVDKEGEYELIVPSPTFGIEVCQETASQGLLFCYEGTSSEAIDLGCDSGYCGGAMSLFYPTQLQVEVKRGYYGLTSRCGNFFISEGGIEARFAAQFGSCNWKKNTLDNSLKLKVVKFPPGWRMIIKRVDTSKSRAKVIASYWWAYLLGIIAVIGLIIGVIFLVKWLLKQKNNAVEKEKQAESGPELKEVKVVKDRKQKEKADCESEKKEAKSQSKPRSTSKKKKNVKVSKPKHTLTPNKEEEAPKSLGTTSDIKAERAAVAAKRWEEADKLGGKIDKEGEYEVIVPIHMFEIEICRETATQDILFCYEGTSNETGDIGCGYGYCGGSMFLAKNRLTVEVKEEDLGVTKK